MEILFIRTVKILDYFLTIAAGKLGKFLFIKALSAFLKIKRVVLELF